MSSVFTTTFDALPASLPLFPLSGALLLPRARLPLNIFEPRYLAMAQDALGSGRLIGMVQRQGEGEDAPLYGVGCAGRIVSFSETEDDRLLVVLEGVCRFKLGADSIGPRGYRRTLPDWTGYQADLATQEEKIPETMRGHLLEAIKPYFKAHNILANWDTIDEASPERLVSSLAGICPLAINEKQALLEAPNLEARAELLLALIGMATHQSLRQPAGQLVTDQVRH